MDFLGVNGTLLLLTGSIVVASAAAIALYFSLFRPRRFGSSKVSPAVDSQITQQVQDTTVPQTSTLAQIKTEQTTPISTTPIQEAPAPFPEESLASPGPMLPTDISAIAPVSSVAASPSPVVVIATPKRRARTTVKKLPGTSTTPNAPRKRRGPKQPNISETTVPPTAVQSVSAEPEASPVTTTTPQTEE